MRGSIRGVDLGAYWDHFEHSYLKPKTSVMFIEAPALPAYMRLKAVEISESGDLRVRDAACIKMLCGFTVTPHTLNPKTLDPTTLKRPNPRP